MIVGADVGFGETKVFTGKGKEAFPTLVRDYKSEEVLIGNVADVVEVNGRQYEIGVMRGAIDLRSLGKEFPFTDYYKALLLYALRGYNGSSVAVGLGVPPAWSDVRENLRKHLSGVLKGKINGVDYEVSVNPYVFLQGWGGYIDYIYTIDGDYLEERDVPALYVDVGYYTIDLTFTEYAFKNGEYVVVPKKTKIPSIDAGVSTLYEIIKNRLNSLGYLNVNVAQVAYYYRTGKTGALKISQKEWQALTEEAYRQWLSFIRSHLRQLKDYFASVEKIHVFGGGAKLVSSIFKDDLFNGVEVTVGDEFANARGYYKAVKAILS